MERRPDGVTVIAIYYFVTAIPALLSACFLVGVPISGVLRDIGDEVGIFFATSSIICLTLLVAGSGILSLVTGWGLLKMADWGRWLALFLAVLSLFLFPLGTIIGGIIIWYLLQDDVQGAFL